MPFLHHLGEWKDYFQADHISQVQKSLSSCGTSNMHLQQTAHGSALRYQFATSEWKVWQAGVTKGPLRLDRAWPP